MSGFARRIRIAFLSILTYYSGAGSIAKYFAKDTFWGFCITSFVFGLFLGNLPVGMAYVGDVFTSKKEKEERLGYLVSCFVMGNSGELGYNGCCNEDFCS